MNKPRRKIEEYKQQLAVSIENDALRYKRAIIRELDYLYRSMRNTNSETKIEDLFNVASQRLRIPLNFRSSIENDLLQTQSNIADVWDEYFSDVAGAGKVITFSEADYERLVAAYSVQFNELEERLKNTIETQFKKSIHSEYSYSQLRAKLKQKDLGDFHSSTLANTAVAGFDNAYMVENAQQAGVTKFIYDGTLKATSREFCVKHFKNIYTLEQLRALNNGQGLAVVPFLGGYNCTHFLTPVI